ncbi:hypothetical protein [Bradyrhizobium elkanii]|jgi:hypothetical protein|uniref:hypothetical protein n=1 Tax=Bradyrhizobium elkanii TaxID=29448 RepID=UPI0035183249
MRAIVDIPWSKSQIGEKIAELSDEIRQLRRFKRILAKREYAQSRDRSEYMREYHAERMREYNARPEVKEKKKAWRQKNPGCSEKRRASLAKYRNTPEFKVKRKLREAGITDADVIAAEVARVRLMQQEHV